MNPVLHKDLLSLLRLKRVAAIQVLFLAVLAVVVMATWPQGGVARAARADAQASAMYRAPSPLLRGLVLGQVVLLLLVVPGMAAVALTGEREANTLEMLYASRLRPGQIILGKSVAAVALPLLLLLGGLPFVGLLSFGGEAQTGEVLWSYAILLLTALMLAAVSLAISAVCRQSATALIVAYVAALALCGAALVPAAIMLASQSGMSAKVMHYVRGLSPVAAALSLLWPVNEMDGRARGWWPLWQVFLPSALALSAAAMAVVAMRLRRSPASGEGFGPAAGSENHRGMGRRLLYLIDPKKPRKPIRLGNPLYAKERRVGSLHGGGAMARLLYGPLFLSLALAAMALYGGPQYADLLRYVAQVLVSFQLALIALVVPSLTTAAISSEVETGTFELLRLSPLRGGQVFWGKFLPALLPALLPNLALLPAYGAVVFIDPAYAPHFLRMLPLIVLAVAVCLVLGLACSAMVGQTSRATVVAYLLTAVLFLLPLLAWWAGGEVLSPRAAAVLAFWGPLVMALNLLPQSAAEIHGLYAYHLGVMGGLGAGLLLISRARLAILLRRGT